MLFGLCCWTCVLDLRLPWPRRYIPFTPSSITRQTGNIMADSCIIDLGARHITRKGTVVKQRQLGPLNRIALLLRLPWCPPDREPRAERMVNKVVPERGNSTSLVQRGHGDEEVVKDVMMTCHFGPGEAVCDVREFRSETF